MTRIERQHHIERLLDQIRDGVGDLEQLRMRGVRGRPLAEREDELSHVRAQLAAIVAHASDDDARTTSSTGRTVVRTAAPGRSRRSTAHSAAMVPSS
jgi:hypothetical protein